MPEWEKTATWRPITSTALSIPMAIALVAMTLPLGFVLDVWTLHPAATAAAVTATLIVMYVAFKNINA